MDKFREIQALFILPVKVSMMAMAIALMAMMPVTIASVAIMPKMIANHMALLTIANLMVPLTITNIMALIVIVMIMTPSPTLAFLYSIKHLMAASHSLSPFMLTCLILS